MIGEDLLCSDMRYLENNTALNDSDLLLHVFDDDEEEAVAAAFDSIGLPHYDDFLNEFYMDDAADIVRGGDYPSGVTSFHPSLFSSSSSVSQFSSFRPNSEDEVEGAKKAMMKRKGGGPKPVECFSLEDGSIVASYPSGMEAQRLTNVTQNEISLVCNGKKENAGGYGWRFSNQPYSFQRVFNQQTTFPNHTLKKASSPSLASSSASSASSSSSYFGSAASSTTASSSVHSPLKVSKAFKSASLSSSPFKVASSSSSSRVSYPSPAKAYAAAKVGTLTSSTKSSSKASKTALSLKASSSSSSSSAAAALYSSSSSSSSSLDVGNLKEKYQGRRRKAVECFSLEDGSFIDFYQSATEAHLKNNISQSDISLVCNGKKESAGGFGWRFSNQSSSKSSSATTKKQQRRTRAGSDDDDDDDEDDEDDEDVIEEVEDDGRTWKKFVDVEYHKGMKPFKMKPKNFNVADSDMPGKLIAVHWPEVIA